jgi:hypothetical protein
MIVRKDENLHQVDETVKKTPLKASEVASLAISSSGSASITVPHNEVWFIKSWIVTKGPDVTVSNIKIDNNETYLTTSLTDALVEYGVLVNSEKDIVITGSNASGTVSQSLEIEVKGYKIIF